MAEFRPSWAPKPKPTEQEQIIALLRDLGERQNQLASAVKALDVKPDPPDFGPVVDAIRRIPTPEPVVVESPAPTPLDLDQLRDALTVNVGSPDLSGLGELLKQTINEMPRGGGGGGPSKVGLKNQNGRAVNPATEDTLAAAYSTLSSVKDRLGATPFSETATVERTPVIALSSVYPLTSIRNITSGTVNTSGAEYEVTAGAKLESGEIGRYQPGYAAEVGIGIRLATLPGSAKWGYYDSNDGIFWQVASGDLQAVLRRSGTDTHTIDRADFNIDKLDGNGPSGITWGANTEHIYQVTFSWYGYGQIEWQLVGQSSTGRQQVWPVHRLDVSGSTSIASPNLPITIECATSGSVFVGGRQMSIIGRYSPNQRITPAVRETSTVSTTLIPLCSFRRKNTTDAKNISIIFEGYTALTNQDIEIVAVAGATLTGASWVTPPNRTSAETAIEVDSSATAFSGGETIWHDLATASGPGGGRRGAAGAALDIRIPRLEPVTLCARRLGSTDATVRAVLRCAEAW